MNSSKFFKAFKIQGRVVFALVLREAAVRYGKTQLGYLWALLTPIIMIFLQVSIFTLIGRHPDLGSDLFLFFAIFTRIIIIIMTAIVITKNSIM